jgi:predicted ATPase
MLTSIRVQNYKSWQDSGEIALTELTGFFGTNGTSKTALLEAILAQHPNVCYFEKCDNPAPVEAAAQWLVENEIVYGYRLDDKQLWVKKTENASEIAIEAAGTGLARTFAIANFCFAASPGATLLFEQPEKGVHQNTQAQMADLFITAVTRGVQIIFESHSESLLHRLQRRIAEKKISQEQTTFYQLYLDDKGYSQTRWLELDEYGGIHNWPQNFFGDPLGELMAQNTASMEDKLRKDRERRGITKKGEAIAENEKVGASSR